MAEQASQLEFAHSSNFTTEVAEQFAQELLDFAGPAFRGGAVFFTSGGSESVESALKLARQYQVESGHSERYQVVSRRQSYHGATLGAMAVSGNESRRGIYLPMLREFPKASIPYCYRCPYDCGNGCADCGLKYAAEVEQAIAETNGTAAAFIMEPVSGATLGAAAPPPSYVKRVAEICREQKVLLIADEVMTGFGRTGRRFAMDHYGVAPDIIAAGKGISSGYAPLGAVIAQRHVVDAIANGTGTLLHGFTYNGHPVSVAAGRAVLQRLLDGQLVEAADSDRAGSVASVLKDELQKLVEARLRGRRARTGPDVGGRVRRRQADERAVSRRKEVRGARERVRAEARRDALSHAGLRRRQARRPRDDRAAGGDHRRRNSLGGGAGERGDPRSKPAS